MIRCGVIPVSSDKPQGKVMSTLRKPAGVMA